MAAPRGHADPRQLPHRLQLLPRRLDGARLPAPRRLQGFAHDAREAQQLRRHRYRQLPGVLHRVVAPAAQHAPPRHQRTRQRPGYPHGSCVHVRSRQSEARGGAQRGAAPAAVLLRADDECARHLLALRVAPGARVAAAQEGLARVGHPRHPLCRPLLALPGQDALPALHDPLPRLYDGHRRLRHTLRRGCPVGRPRPHARGADRAHVAQHHRWLPRQRAHGLHFAADGASPVPDGADRAAREGAAARALLLQAARAHLPRIQPRRVRQAQHQGARPRRGARFDARALESATTAVRQARHICGPA
mmetsp:Transcript_6751/g.17678  ORF Transcript_6751/g.17678 Transcript_6751/m.17678 type:complete len:305 (-) Transcript_6751:454-1368(-)